MTDEQRQLIRDGLAEWAKIPHKERWADMIRRGVIDEQGNVLLLGPEPWPPEPENGEVEAGREPEAKP